MFSNHRPLKELDCPTDQVSLMVYLEWFLWHVINTLMVALIFMIMYSQFKTDNSGRPKQCESSNARCP